MIWDSNWIDTYGFAGEHTHYQRNLAGNVRQLVDPKPATYYFDYDALNRKTNATYPVDATNAVRTETYSYDSAGNLALYKNPADQYNHLDFADSYDSRNRLRHTAWNLSSTTASADSSIGQEVTTNYDNASRLTSVVTNGGATTVSFGYDDANRQTWEEQIVAGFPTRRVETPRDDDGLRASLATPAYTLSYGYTWRGQLRTISFANGTQWFSYIYDLAGNLTKRQDILNGVNDSTNVMDANSVSQYDALNRPTMWEQTGTVNGTHDSAFARSHFAYDSLSRLTASWRDEQAGKGEWFGYHATGQLTDVAYNADNVSSGTPQNATRTVNYAVTPDTLNRSTMTDSPDQSGAGGELSVYSPNALNQYTDLNGGGLYYDGNFNLMWTGGFSAGYDADKRLTAIASGEDYGQFVYDGLGRCLKRTIDWETILITYDGWKPIVEWDEWNGLKAWNVYGPRPDEILYRHDAYLAVDLRYHLDRMGNVVFILDSDGDGIERYTYDAFGTPTVTDWNGNNARTYSWYGNRFMFTGREYFPELGLYDFRFRMYHPVLGRFLQSDPIGFGAGDANLFRYCGGDPVNRSDPSGLRGPDPRFNNEGIDPGALGEWNWSLGSGSGPGSTQGFWSGPSGIPTGVAGGGSGPALGSRLGNGSGDTTVGWVGVTQRVIVAASDVSNNNPSSGINPAADFFGFRLGDVSWLSWLPQRMPDSLQLSFAVPAPVKGLAWFGAQGALSFYPRTGQLFLGLGPGVGVPQNEGYVFSANWIGSWSDPNSPAVSGEKSISIDVSGAWGPGGVRSWGQFGQPNSFGIGYGSKGLGIGAISTFQLIPQWYGPKG